MTAVRRKAGESDIILEGKKISFNYNLSAAVLQRQKKFTEAKRRLRDIRAESSMLFPARLQVSFNGKKKTFLSPTVALSFVSSLASQG